MQAASRVEVPDAVSLSDPLFCLGLVEVITEWRNGFGRTPSPGHHQGTHTRWSVIASCRSQWFARESIVIIHHFSCIHIIWLLHSLFASHPLKICLSSITTRVPSYWPPSNLPRFIHRLISRYRPSPANPTATDTSSSIRCLLLQRRRRPAQSRVM
jgi:hypothetical protein